jgi:hypothetical protein
LAEHEPTAPPLAPEQAQLHGPSVPPLIALGVPEAHRPLVGALLISVPSALPQVPSIFSGLFCAEAAQLTSTPPLPPLQTHVHGPVPSMLDGVPEEHRPEKGAEASAVPLAGPQAPLSVFGVAQEIL